ncbi:MAG: hypothetical protein EBX50_17955 [Chitinophagia bacterium]|nr:hypothetical protein [Chitinophagia bacterium]
MFNNRINFERDDKISKLEDSLLKQMASIVEPPKPEEVKNNIKTISLEDALKELMELEKQTK